MKQDSRTGFTLCIISLQWQKLTPGKLRAMLNFRVLSNSSKKKPAVAKRGRDNDSPVWGRPAAEARWASVRPKLSDVHLSPGLWPLKSQPGISPAGDLSEAHGAIMYAGFLSFLYICILLKKFPIASGTVGTSFWLWKDLFLSFDMHWSHSSCAFLLYLRTCVANDKCVVKEVFGLAWKHY